MQQHIPKTTKKAVVAVPLLKLTFISTLKLWCCVLLFGRLLIIICTSLADSDAVGLSYFFITQRQIVS